MPVHFHFPKGMFMVRQLNQAQGVCKAFSHQWDLWLRNGCTTLTNLDSPGTAPHLAASAWAVPVCSQPPPRDHTQEKSRVLRSDVLPWTLIVAEVDAVPCSLVATQV